MATSASIHFSIPHALFLHRSAGAGASPSTLCTPFSLKPLPKLAISPCVTDRPYSRFIRNVAFSSDLDEDVEAGEEDSLDFSAAEEPYFSPDLKLFVGNLPFNIDSAVLAELFGKVGNVEMVEVIYDKQTGRSRGFGFVTMSTVEEVVAAAERFNGYELEGRALRVNSGPPPSKEERPSFRGGREGGSPFRGGREGGSPFRGGREGGSPFRGGREGGSPFRGGRDGERTGFNDSNKLYVGNLAWAVDDLALETLFSEQGRVKEARVVYDRESGRSRGFGFVTYSSAEEVTNAIEMFDGIDLSGRSIRVSVAESRPSREY